MLRLYDTKLFGKIKVSDIGAKPYRKEIYQSPKIVYILFFATSCDVSYKKMSYLFLLKKEIRFQITKEIRHQN